MWVIPMNKLSVLFFIVLSSSLLILAGCNDPLIEKNKHSAFCISKGFNSWEYEDFLSTTDLDFMCYNHFEKKSGNNILNFEEHYSNYTFYKDIEFISWKNNLNCNCACNLTRGCI